MTSLHKITHHRFFHLAILCALIIVAVLLRLSNISAEEFWYDEILSLIIGHYGADAQEILSYVREVYHPPLYYFFSRGWTHLFGLTELSGRMFALVFSVASIPLLFALGTKMFNKNIALLAALFMAVSPLQIEFGQEARPYSLIMFLGLASMYFFWRYIMNQQKHGYVAVVFILNLIGIYTHYDYFMIIAAQTGIGVLLLLLHKREEWARRLSRNIFLSMIGLGVLFLPWLIYAFVPNLTGISYALGENAISVMDIFLRGELWFTVLAAERMQAFIMFIGQITVITLLVYGGRHMYERLKGGSMERREELALLTIVGWYVCSLAFYYYSPLSAQYTPNWQRHIIIFGSPFYLMVAYSIFMLTLDRLKVFSTFLILASMIMPVIYVSANDSLWSLEHQNKYMIEHIEQQEKPGDLIFIPGALWETVVLYYYTGSRPIASFVPLKEFDSIAERPTYYMPAIEEARYKYKLPSEEDFLGVEKLHEIVGSYRRVWLFGPKEIPEVYEWFMKNMRFAECGEKTCKRLILFENPNYQ